jgi:DNA-binding response OmpR family regulator
MMDIIILVVDDEEYICDLVSKSLSRFGYLVDTADNYDSAVERLANTSYDIVITDKNMPGTNGESENGIRLLKYVKRHFPSTEVIIMTGYASIETAIEAMKSGAFDYITKPFMLDDLKEKVTRIIEYRSFINSKLNLNIYKNIHTELLGLVENQDHLSNGELHPLLKNLGRRIDHLFGSQKEFESIIQLQKETLENVQTYAEELRDLVPETDPAFDLIQKILKESAKRIT